MFKSTPFRIALGLSIAALAGAGFAAASGAFSGKADPPAATAGKAAADNGGGGERDKLGDSRMHERQEGRESREHEAREEEGERETATGAGRDDD